MDLGTFLSFGLALFILIIKPGPIFFTYTLHTLKYGFGHASCFAVGIALSEIIYFWLAATGYALTEDLRSFLQILFQTSGAALLIYLGIKGLTQFRITQFETQEKEKTIKGYLRSTAVGFFLTIGNPISMVFYLTLVPTFFGEIIGKPDLFLQGIAAILIFEISPYFIAAWALLKFGNFLKNERILQKVNIVSSLLLIGLGVFIAWSTFPNLSFESLYY